MKKLFFIISIVFISITPSFAFLSSMYVEAGGAYIRAGDLKNETGFGGGLGIGITDTLNAGLRFISTEKTIDADLESETNFDHFTMQVGVEYVPVIPVLEQYQLSWNTSFYAGTAKSGYEYYDQDKGEQIDGDEDGLSFAFWTGPHFYLSQNLSFFAEVGYHYCYYSNVKDASVKGFQVLAGVRCYIFGSRDYAKGY